MQQQGSSTLQHCQHRTGTETGSTAGISLSNPQPVLLAKKSSLPRVPVGAKCDARPQLHPRQSTSSFALVCSNILWPAKELGAGSGREVGRDARSSHASPLLPTKTAAPSYSAHALGVLFGSQIVSRAKATHALPSERGEVVENTQSAVFQVQVQHSCAGRVMLAERTAQLTASGLW